MARRHFAERRNGLEINAFGIRRITRARVFRLSAPVILVVEDDPTLCYITSALIEDVGYEVITALNADEAIEILEHNKNIRVVFTDVEMPGSMDGLNLAKVVRNRWPSVEIILTSGHHGLVAADLPEGTLFLLKPYRSDSLLAAMPNVDQARS
jgi:CheY-like chemotaxis protein